MELGGARFAPTWSFRPHIVTAIRLHWGEARSACQGSASATNSPASPPWPMNTRLFVTMAAFARGADRTPSCVRYFCGNSFGFGRWTTQTRPHRRPDPPECEGADATPSALRALLDVRRRQRKASPSPPVQWRATAPPRGDSSEWLSARSSGAGVPPA